MIDFSDYCRICATQSKHLLSLYHDVESDKPFAEMVKVCTRLSFYEFELRPKFICTSCVTKLKIAYDLYNLIQNSEETFKSIISSQMFLKSEQDDTIEDAVNTGGGFNTYNLESSMDNLIRVDGIKTECIFAEELNISSLYDETEPPITPEPTIRKKSGRSKKNDTEPLPVCNERNNDTNKPKLQFECYKCKLSLPSIVRLNVHLKEHDAIRKCRICVKNFTQLEYIKHSCNGKHFKCQYCMKIFQTTHTLVKHINSNHKDHPNYKCYKCAKAFHTKELLEIHKPTHNKEQKRFICDICGACYRTRFQIKEHMESTHTDKRSNCIFAFFQSIFLKYLTTFFHFLSEFLCATCGKSFKNPTHLRAHINRHTLTKSIDCPKCPKRFFDKYGLKKHLDIHNDSQFVCDICGSVMRTRASYTEHKRMFLEYDEQKS